MITSTIRGHSVEFIDGKWVYSDTKRTIKKERPCIRCGKMPTIDGYDSCIGFIEGILSACCGHGVTEIIIKEA